MEKRSESASYRGRKDSFSAHAAALVDEVQVSVGDDAAGAHMSIATPPDTSSMEDHEEPHRHIAQARKRTGAMVRPIRTCFILAMPWAAYSVLNTVFEDIRIPYMQSMDMGEFIPRFLPALVALFLGPILGAASDRSLSKWGRRNVFLVVGSLILTISGVLFSSAQTFFRDYRGFTNLLFFLLTIGLVVVNISLRARLMDEVPIQYQVHAQAALAFWAGFGAVVGNFLFRSTTVVVYATDIQGKDFLISFSAAMGGIIATTALCLWLRPEHPQTRPPFHPPVDRLIKEVREQIVYAPRVFRVLCLVYSVQLFAWNAFRDEAYVWWAKNIYDGCNDAACSAEGQKKYKDGLDTANRGLMGQNGLQLLVCLLILGVIPRDIFDKLKRLAIIGLSLGTVALIVALAIDSAWIPGTFAAFVAIAFYQIVVAIFPYSVVGIVGKEMQESAHGFNNNGLYIGVLTSFSAVAQLFVQIYGTENMASMGTGNVMTLPCVLFIAGILATLMFSSGRR